MTQPAIRKIIERTQEWLNGCAGAVTFEIDRPFDNPFHEDELSAVHIHCDRLEYQSSDWYGDTIYAFVMMDIMVPSGTISIGEQEAEIAACITTRMHNRGPIPGTIGELLQDAQWLSFGRQDDGFGLSDHGTTTFVWRFTYQAPAGDFRAIAGTTGGLIP